MGKGSVRLESLGPPPAGPFPVSLTELLAVALDEAGLLDGTTQINGSPAADYVQSYRRKESTYREETRLGSLLVRRGLLSDTELSQALRRQREREGTPLGDVLIELNLCDAAEIDRQLSEQEGIRRDIDDLERFRRKIDSIKRRLSGTFQ